MRFVTLIVLAFLPFSAFADDDNAALIAAGQTVYSQTCIACHGANGKGAIPGVPGLANKDGPLSKSDEALIFSITEGVQIPGSPLAMPPKGGNPALTAEDVRAVLAYMRATFGS